MTQQGGWLVATLRLLADGSLLSMLGALVFRALIGQAGQGVARWSAAAACLALPAWATAEGIVLGVGVDDVADVLRLTQFGHLVAGSWVCAVVVLALGGRGWRLLACLAAAVTAVVLQSGHSHAAAMDPGVSVARASITLHLLAAAAWLGGLVPLASLVQQAPLPDAMTAVRRYSILGVGCVLVLVATATWQAAMLVGGLAGWIGTEYGHVAIAKAALFTVLVGFAALNRFWLSPGLASSHAARSRRRLAISIAAETVAGLVVVGAAVLLSNLEPATHQQPVWPFAYRPSLVSLSEDAEIWWEVVLAGLALGSAVTLLAAALALRRLRVPAVIAAACVAVLARPHLGLLFVPAYPTSFYQSPTAFAAYAIVRGGELFALNCAACHGQGGRGDGPLAATSPSPPADLTAGHLWMHSDGELFWWLSHGIEGPAGGLVMPGFSPALPDDALWALIDYVRANNSGLARHAEGVWSPPLLAPELVATCPDGRQTAMADLRGRVVQIWFPGSAPAAVHHSADRVILVAGPSSDECVVLDPSVREAYALVLGVPEADLPGTTVLIDPNGWLREADATRLDPGMFATLVRRIRDHPLPASAGEHSHAD